MWLSSDFFLLFIVWQYRQKNCYSFAMQNCRIRLLQQVAVYLVSSLLAGFLCLPALSVSGNQSIQSSYQPTLRLTEFGTLDCGFDANGADEALHNHRRNLHLDNNKTPNRAITAPPQMKITNNIAVIEDDGSLILPPNKFDLNNSSLLFIPDGNTYRLSRGDIAFSKDYGTRIEEFLGIDDAPLDNANNGYYRLSLAAQPFSYFGISYAEIFIGTNGFVTFTRGDTTGRTSAAMLAQDMPRLAPLWADLDVSENGGIYFNRLADALLITWDKAPQAQYSSPSTFQLRLFNDGRIAFVYKKVKVRNALIGLSPGYSASEAQSLDFSTVQSEPISRAIFESFSKQKRLDIPALTRAFYAAQPDDFDTLYIWTDFAFDNGAGYATFFNVRNTIQGIGLKQFDKGAAYGSAARLASISIMGDIVRSWPDDPNANVVGLYSAVAIVCHEQGHRWLSYVRFKSGNSVRDDLLGRERSHWSFLMNTQSAPDRNASSIMEGNVWSAGSSNSFTSSQTAANYYSELDQYLMGLRSADEVNDLTYLDISEPLKSSLRIVSPAVNVALAAEKKTVALRQIIAQEGERAPDASQAPKNFRIAYLLLTERGVMPSADTVNRTDRYRAALERYFSLATSRRGSLDGRLSQNQSIR